MDIKNTLINLHKSFPELSLDDLFRILDCIVLNPIINIPSWAPGERSCDPKFLKEDYLYVK